ncbi:MAG TPA: PilZ domain-containing protein [Terriglobales bacterium]
MLTLILPEMGMVAEHTPSISRARERLNQQRFDAIIVDYRSDQSSREILTRWRQSSKNRGTLLIAIVDNESNARPVFGMGANFVLYRPLSAERTRVSLRAARGLMRHERRRAPRIPVMSHATVAYPGAAELSATLNDLSKGGTSLTTQDRIPPACKVYFEFALPGQPQLVRLSGEVAWQDSTGRTGIRFLDVPQASRRLMQAWLQHDSFGQIQSGPPKSAPAVEHRWAKQKTDSAPVSNSGNRRGERRFPCKLGAEVYSLGTNVPNRCALSDISEGGCYVEMPSPLDYKSSVEILVHTAEMKLKIRGQVLATHPGFGMGVRFVFRDSAEREEVLRLLAVLSAGPSLDEIPQ